MKKFLLLWILGLTILAGCAQQGLSQSELFEKKQECANLREKIEGSLWETRRLKQIFYSEKENSCLYEIESKTNDGSMKYEVFDYLSSERLLCTSLWSTCIDNKQMESYIEELEELKSE